LNRDFALGLPSKNRLGKKKRFLLHFAIKNEGRAGEAGEE